MKQQISLLVKGKHNGERIDQFLLATLSPDHPNLQRPALQGLIRLGQVEVNDRVVRASYRVKPGETVSVVLAGASPNQTPIRETLSPIIIFEDARILVINKPAGLTMHPAREDQSGTLADWVREHYPRLARVGESALRPGMVHRLDRDTSGLVVLAKTKVAFLALKKLFQERKVQKTYTALVHGVTPKKGCIQAPIGRIRGSERRGIPLPKRLFAGEARPGETEYELSTSYPQYSLLLVKPKTGRTHQIRVHLASIGHPVVGDRLYGFKKHRQDPLNTPFQLLHASAMAFRLLNHNYDFSAPLPDYFQRAIASLSGGSERG